MDLTNNYFNGVYLYNKTPLIHCFKQNSGFKNVARHSR